MSPSKEKFAEGSFLSDEFLRQLTAVGEVDVLVGVPTLNNAQTVGHVARAVQLGFAKYFPRERAVLINPDGGSRDGTPEVLSSTSIEGSPGLLSSRPLRTVHRISTRYPGLPSRGSALRTILAAADLLRAKACAVVSPDLRSIAPEWIEHLLRPVHKEKFDYVAPVYHRHKFDGLLVSNLLYPMLRATYGHRLREPMSGEFACSGRLAAYLLEQDVWEGDPDRHGIDLWLTTTALGGGHRVCQSFLGPKIHASKEAGQDLVVTIQRVVGSLCRTLKAHESWWFSRAGSEPVPTFGFEYEVGREPIRINRKRMLQMFRSGVQDLAPVLESILTPETLGEVRAVAQLGDSAFRYPDELWVKTVYEFVSSYHRSVINRDHLLQALPPLYRGRINSFVLQNLDADEKEVERALEGLCLEYERLKPYLIERWIITK